MSTVDTIAWAVMAGCVGFFSGALFMVASFNVTRRREDDQ